MESSLRKKKTKISKVEELGNACRVESIDLRKAALYQVGYLLGTLKNEVVKDAHASS